MMVIGKTPLVALSLNIILSTLPLALLIPGAATATGGNDLPKLSYLHASLNQSPSHQEFGAETCLGPNSCSTVMDRLVSLCVDPETQMADREAFVCMCSAVEELQWKTFWDEFQTCQKCLRQYADPSDIPDGPIVDWSAEGPRVCRVLNGDFQDVTTTTPRTRTSPPNSEPTDDFGWKDLNSSIEEDRDSTSTVSRFITRTTETEDTNPLVTPTTTGDIDPETTSSQASTVTRVPFVVEEDGNDDTSGAGSILRLGNAGFDGSQAVIWAFVLKIAIVVGMNFMF